jgi:hypothetical protein
MKSVNTAEFHKKILISYNTPITRSSSKISPNNTLTTAQIILHNSYININQLIPLPYSALESNEVVARFWKNSAYAPTGTTLFICVSSYWNPAFNTYNL